MTAEIICYYDKLIHDEIVQILQKENLTDIDEIINQQEQPQLSW